MNAFDHDTIFVDLTIRFLTGDISKEEMSQLETLLEEKSENRKLFNEIKLSWEASGSYSNHHIQGNSNDSWKTVSQNISASSSIDPDKDSRKYSIYNIFRIAAFWIFLITTGAFATWFIMRSGNPASSGKYCVINTPLGSKTHMVLPDGSDVWLNAGSTIQYPTTFSSKQRDILLTGEAYFKVASNKKWPFVVHTSDLNIRALGTAFNVKAYPTEKTVTTTLVEGIVELENTKRNFTYTLKPKQELVFLKVPESKKNNSTHENTTTPVFEENKKLESIQNAVLKNEVNTEMSISWKDKRWILQGESIENLAIMLERRYNIKINVVSEELNQFKFSGTIENETVEQVLNYLRYTIPMKYALNKGYIDLKIDNSLKEKYQVFLKKDERLRN